MAKKKKKEKKKEYKSGFYMKAFFATGVFTLFIGIILDIRHLLIDHYLDIVKLTLYFLNIAPGLVFLFLWKIKEKFLKKDLSVLITMTVFMTFSFLFLFWINFFLIFIQNAQIK